MQSLKMPTIIYLWSSDILRIPRSQLRPPSHPPPLHLPSLSQSGRYGCLARYCSFSVYLEHPPSLGVHVHSSRTIPPSPRIKTTNEAVVSTMSDLRLVVNSTEAASSSSLLLPAPHLLPRPGPPPLRPKASFTPTTGTVPEEEPTYPTTFKRPYADPHEYVALLWG